MKTIIALISLNVLLFCIAWGLGLNRIWFNIDYVICCLVLAYGFKRIGIACLAFSIFADVLLLLGQVFPFFRLDEIIYIIKFIFISSIYYQFLLILLSVIYIGILWRYYSINWNKEKTLYIVFFIAIIFVGETLYSQSLNMTNRLINSLLSSFVEKQFVGFNQSLYEKSENLKNEAISQATKELNNQINRKEIISNKILFVVVESLGLPKQDAITYKILQPLRFLQNDKISPLVIQSPQYMMATVHGELRELCSAVPQNFNLRDLDKGFENCLPNKLKKLNFKTSAYHGALSIMYDRKDWYPRAGFEKTFFYESKPWKSRCYSFPGICDTEISDAIAEQFKSNDKQFVYWLTLNSHAPYDLRDIQYDLLKCEEYDIDANSMSCRNLKLQAQFFYVLSKMIQQPQFSNTQVIIVGDHSPIIFDQTEKANVFDGNKVLMLKFNVK
ncbi:MULTISPECIES: sulfatase-like hydrolase/transferase [unclassified Acinetobacter]|uniref:sulfatase-like hydrolase/transferase n=1 Tax=unclassified Acinetobacter TaxID=196816 RepID=UPI0015D25142|nr:MULTISPECIES: sulfatase-like hydrolase/transferase [unclassified Acinetobacter]